MPYVAPFVTLIALLGVAPWLLVSPRLWYPIRVVVVAAVLAATSRSLVSFRAGNWPGSVAIGVGVFVLWIAPDLLWPSYRSHWLFGNSLVGSAGSPVLPGGARGDVVWVVLRVLGSVALVPVVEELFWRGWLMRWLIRPDFQDVRLGTYAHSSFWLTAVLFAFEHGAYWDVGLLAGVVYNWWMVRTARLADCIVAHAITNGLLATYVLCFGQWQYWL